MYMNKQEKFGKNSLVQYGTGLFSFYINQVLSFSASCAKIYMNVRILK